MSRIVLHVEGVGNLIPFKNRKRIAGKHRNKLITEKRVAKQMAAITRSFESQLLSAFRTVEGETSTDALRQFLTALLPLDDAWMFVPEAHIKAELCEHGREGATVEIFRLKT